MKISVLLLCGVAVLEGVQGWFYPSRCPPSFIPAKNCPTKKYACLRNTDCKQGQICCSDRCGRACKTPVSTTQGFCPKKPPASSPRICPAVLSKCRRDTDCRRGQKCCTNDGCFYDCVAPVSRKPRNGLCPRQSVWYPCRRIYNQCDVDNQCPRGQKCCRGPCGRKCTEIIRPRPGYCPKKGPSIPPLICPAVVDKCKNDQDCGKGLKCCSDDGCFSRCVRTVSGRPRPGTCPSYDKTIRCFRLDNQCDVDNQCSKGQKCCQAPCGRQCVLAVANQVPGTCPPPSGLIGTCDFNPGRGDCLNDGQCASRGQLCCREGCGKRCKNPVGGVKPVPPSVPGTCPPPSGLLGTCDFNPGRGDCLKDSECASRGQLCCREGCGKRCKNPVGGVKPVPPNERCPPVNTEIRCIAFINQCGDDKKCGRGLICCPGQCGRECERPITVRPGTCPKPPSPAVVSCLAPVTDKCSSDSECNTPEKCCPHPCGKSCRNPFKSDELSLS